MNKIVALAKTVFFTPEQLALYMDGLKDPTLIREFLDNILIFQGFGNNQTIYKAATLALAMKDVSVQGKVIEYCSSVILFSVELSKKTDEEKYHCSMVLSGQGKPQKALQVIEDISDPFLRLTAITFFRQENGMNI